MRGSFTGAYRDRLGAFEQANRGTVFMDEIGETSPRMQGLLLRFLETGEIQRVGSDQVQTRVDVRVIAATNRVLVDSVANKTFREDLYYRLNVIHIRVPPLRDRVEDIPVLLRFFLDQFAQAVSGRVVRRFRQTRCRRSPSIRGRATFASSRTSSSAWSFGRKNGEIGRDDLPLEVLRSAPAAQPAPSTPATRPAADMLFERMVNGGESFWSCVYAPFMARDLTRDDLRTIVQEGTGADVGQLQGDGRAVQHAGRRLQAVPGLPPQVPVPHAVSAVPVCRDQPRRGPAASAAGPHGRVGLNQRRWPESRRSSSVARASER